MVDAFSVSLKFGKIDISAHTTEKTQEILHGLSREPVQNSHLLLLSRAPEEGEVG